MCVIRCWCVLVLHGLLVLVCKEKYSKWPVLPSTGYFLNLKSSPRCWNVRILKTANLCSRCFQVVVSMNIIVLICPFTSGCLWQCTTWPTMSSSPWRHMSTSTVEQTAPYHTVCSPHPPDGWTADGRTHRRTDEQKLWTCGLFVRCNFFFSHELCHWNVGYL